MSGISVFNEYGEEIDRRLRLRSFPLAVKMLGKEEDAPEGAKRPKRDFGYHLSTCQAFFTSRNRLGQGMVIASLKEDMWCFEPVIGYGLAAPPAHFLAGHNRFPESVSSLEAGSNWAHAFPRFEFGKYIGIVSAPLTTASFDPDVVIIYCNSAQLTNLLMARVWKDGQDITCRMSGHAACVYSVVPAIQRGECQVTIPCLGDRRRAMAQDDELIFSVPKGKLEDLVLALRHFEESGYKPVAHPMVMPEYELVESYAEIARMLGMDVDR